MMGHSIAKLNRGHFLLGEQEDWHLRVLQRKLEIPSVSEVPLYRAVDMWMIMGALLVSGLDEQSCSAIVNCCPP